MAEFHVKQSAAAAAAPPPVCDYEGHDYQAAFWGAGRRQYEDTVERHALRALLPRTGRRLVDIGAGYGRLADLYAGYDEVILLDYARSQLLQARQHWTDARFRFVLADVYNLPLCPASVDAAVTVRVLHHIQAMPAVVSGIRRIVAAGGCYVLEFANKRHVKALARYALRRQVDSPLSLQPYEYQPLHFDFHPAYIERILRVNGFRIEARRAVSLFRLSALKRLVPQRVLVGLDVALQQPMARLAPSPSLMLRAAVPGAVRELAANLWSCPDCHTPLHEREAGLSCSRCGAEWPLKDGIYDLRSPRGVN